MSVFAELADGRRLEFPDGTDPAVIQATVKKVLAPKETPKPLGPVQELTDAEKFAQKLGFLEKLPDVRNNPVTQGVSELGIGLTQAAANSGPVRGSFPELTQSVNDAVRKNEEGYQASRGKDAGSFDPARLASSILNPLALGAAGKLFTAMPTAGARIAIPSIYGAAQGGSAPVTDAKTESDYDKQAGKNAIVAAILSTLIPGGWEAAKAGGRTIRNVTQGAFDPQGASGRLMNEAAGARAPAVRDSLLQAEAGQTAQQAVVPSGSTEAAALIEIAKKRKPSDFRDISIAQQEARLGEIRKVGKDEVALDAAVAARKGAASEDYGRAGKALVKGDDEFASLLEKPSVEKIMSRAADLAKEQGKPFVIGKNKPEEIVNSLVLDAKGNPATQSVIPAEFQKYPGDSLHFMKMAMDDLIKNPERFGIGAAEVKAISDTQRKLVGWIERKVPEYAQARANYREASKPVNQMKVGQVLEEKLRTPLDVSERPGVFATAVQNAPATVKKAGTGQSFEKLSDVLDEPSQKIVDAIMKGLQTDAYAKEMARAGMDKAGRLVGDMSHVQGTGLLNRYITLGTSALRKVASGATDKTMDSLAELSKDPKRLAEVMAAATPGERKAIVDALMQGQARAIGVGQGGGQ